MGNLGGRDSDGGDLEAPRGINGVADALLIWEGSTEGDGNNSSITSAI